MSMSRFEWMNFCVSSKIFEKGFEDIGE